MSSTTGAVLAKEDSRFYFSSNAQHLVIYERVGGKRGVVPRFKYALSDAALAENAVDVLNHMTKIWTAVPKDAPEIEAE